MWLVVHASTNFGKANGSLICMYDIVLWAVKNARRVIFRRLDTTCSQNVFISRVTFSLQAYVLIRQILR